MLGTSGRCLGEVSLRSTGKGSLPLYQRWVLSLPLPFVLTTWILFLSGIALPLPLTRTLLEGVEHLASPVERVRSSSIPLGKAVDRRGTRARGFPARPFAAFMLGICWGNQTLLMPALKICRLTWTFSGPEEIRTPDLTRASGAEGFTETYSHLHSAPLVQVRRGSRDTTTHISLHPLPQVTLGICWGCGVDSEPAALLLAITNSAQT